MSSAAGHLVAVSNEPADCSCTFQRRQGKDVRVLDKYCAVHGKPRILRSVPAEANVEVDFELQDNHDDV